MMGRSIEPELHQQSVFLCDLDDNLPGTGVCALVEGRQLAVFRVADAVFALDNDDPMSGANVLSRGLTGDIGGELVVASPIYKHHYSLSTGRCLEDASVRLRTYPCWAAGGRVWTMTPLSPTLFESA